MNREPEDHEQQAALRRLLPAAWLLAMSLTLPLAAQAADALRVVRDTVTGELRGPTAAEAAAFEKAEEQLRLKNGKAAAPKTPVEVRYPDGTVETKLGEDTMMYSVVKENADGTLAMACLPARQAQAFVKASGKKAAPAKPVLAAKPQAGHSHD